MRGLASVACVAGALVTACTSSHEPFQPCAPTPAVSTLTYSVVDSVDLLFVIDDSSSMGVEQALLAEELPRLLRIVATGDVDEDGDTLDPGDFDGVRDLHVGVITTDMGTAGQVVPTCADADLGDDGLLQNEGRSGGCDASYPRILTFGAERDPERLARDLACVASVGTAGCGIEQPLEAVLKALTPVEAQAWTSPSFAPVGAPGAPEGLAAPVFRATQPHGDRENAGFAREGSVLAIVLVSDENDCSILDPELFAPDSERYDAELGLRCFAHPEALHPIERYVNGLLQLRVREPMLVFAPIVGIPPELVPGPGESPDWTALAAPECDERDPRLCERVDPASPTGIVPSCGTADTGSAMPPTRVLEVARGLAERGARVSLGSICEGSYRDTFTSLVRTIWQPPVLECDGLELAIEPDGSVACELTALLPRGVECADEGYEPLADETGAPSREGDRVLCAVPQRVPASRTPGSPRPSGAGWYYDDFTTEGRSACERGVEVPRIAFVTLPPSGSRLSFSCEVPGHGAACEPEADSCAALAPALACDPLARWCGVPCTSDRDCRDAMLFGFVCDTRPLGELDPARFAGDERAHGFCVSPTCG